MANHPRAIFSAALAAVVFLLLPVRAAELDPKAITITLPDNIPWKKGPNQDNATLVGDPSKPGIYIQMLRWHAGNNSRPHMHSTDRFITVLSGTLDQGSLHQMLDRVRALGLELVEVRQVPPDGDRGDYLE